MTTSDQINEIAAALAKAQASMKNAVLNKVNPHFKSKFADLGDCMDCLREPLQANGLAVPQLVIGAELHTTLMHVSGQYIVSIYPLAPVADTPQGMGSAITYARRYALCAMFGLVGEPDDDGNAASNNASKDAAAQRAAFLKKVQSTRPEPAVPTGVNVENPPF